MKIASILAISAIVAIASTPLISCQLKVSPVREDEDTSPAGGTASRSIYAAGLAYMGNNLYKPILWVNGSSQLLPLPTGKTGGKSYAIKISSGNIYIAGDVMDAENTTHPCVWVIPLGSEPQEPFLLSIPPNHMGGDPGLTALFVENNTVYTAGALVDVTNAGNPQFKVGYWRNFTSLTFLSPPEFYSLGSIGHGGLWVKNGSVFIAGGVNIQGNSSPYLWKNGTPIPLSLPNGINRGRVYRAFLSEGFLYVAGYYLDSSTSVPCYWKYDTGNDTSTSIKLSGYAPNTSNFNFEPFIDGSNVYMGGALGIPNEDGWTPVFWKNGIPTPVPLPAGQNGGIVTGLSIKDRIVYVAGFYGDPEGIGSEAFIWKGATKMTVSSPPGSMGTQIYSMVVE